jgi:hypothetical protein
VMMAPGAATGCSERAGGSRATGCEDERADLAAAGREGRTTRRSLAVLPAAAAGALVVRGFAIRSIKPITAHGSSKRRAVGAKGDRRYFTCSVSIYRARFEMRSDFIVDCGSFPSILPKTGPQTGISAVP